MPRYIITNMDRDFLRESDHLIHSINIARDHLGSPFSWTRVSNGFYEAWNKESGKKVYMMNRYGAIHNGFGDLFTHTGR